MIPSLTRTIKTASPKYARCLSVWESVPLGPPDAILGLSVAFKNDPATVKLNLGVGAYRDDDGKPFVLPSVREAEQRIFDAHLDHEYLPISGNADFVSAATKFAYGSDSPAILENRVGAIQALSGTGALRTATSFCARFLGQGRQLLLPSPTWGNHVPITRDAGLTVGQYRYLNPTTHGLDFGGMVDDWRAAAPGSLVLLHACAHNPTGVDPSAEQWREMSAVLRDTGHTVLFDCAYQGFASGDAEKDAFAIRQFVQDGHNIILAQSFSKNFGLYGQRVGAISIVGADAEEAERLTSQLKILVRPVYSNPPLHGARIVSTILNDDGLADQWTQDCKSMADRIHGMRGLLKASLQAAGSSLDWAHITDQIGMFCFSGLNKQQVETLRTEYHIYMTGDGRISMAGVTPSNAQYLADAMHAVTK